MDLSVRQEAEEILAVFFFIAQHCVGVVLQRYKLVFIELLVLDVVKSNDILFLEITQDHIQSFFLLNLMKESWTPSQIVKDVTDF